MQLRARLDVELFSADELQRMADAAIRLWGEIPLRVQGTDELFDYLSDFGCAIDGENVGFPPAVRDAVLARVAAEKAAWLWEHEGTQAPFPGDGITVFTHGQALLACDLESNRLRAATTRDLEEWCRVVDALDIAERSHPTFIPTDVPTGCSDFLTYATIILNSARPHRVSVYSAEMLPYFIRACAIAHGSEEAPRIVGEFATTMWVNSPFMVTRENVMIAMEARRLLGRPLRASTMPVAGAAAPVTVAGQVVQTTAESLALNAVTLAVDDRTCGIMTNALVMDMRAGAHRQAGPDVVLHRAAAHQMHCHLFGGRPRIWGFNAGAQVVGPQSLLEKAMGISIEIMSGTRSIGAGCLAASDVGSLVQLIVDCEIADAFRHMLREVEATEERMGEATIRTTAPAGARYLDCEHTGRFFREESWLPGLLDYRVPMAWQADPSDMIRRAQARARRLAAGAENHCPLSDGQRRAIKELMGEARAQAAGTHPR